MSHQTVEVVAKNRASLEALAARLGLGSPIKLYISSKLWVATFLSKEEQERQQIAQQRERLTYIWSTACTRIQALMIRATRKR